MKMSRKKIRQSTAYSIHTQIHTQKYTSTYAHTHLYTLTNIYVCKYLGINPTPITKNLLI